MIQKRRIDINFDGYFDSVANYTFLRELPHNNKFPDIQAEIEKYRRSLDSEAKEFDYICDGRQYYHREFFLDPDSKYSYKIYWDIKKANELIEKYQLKPTVFEINELMRYIDPYTLDQTKLNNLNYQPIIVACYDPTNFVGIIDGNHRAYSNYIKGKSRIEGYFLPPAIQLEAMACSTFATVYKIHHNIVVITNYVMGGIDNFKICNNGYNDCLYDFSEFSKNPEQGKDGLLRRLKNIFWG